MIPTKDLMSKSNRDPGPCYFQSFPTSNGLESVSRRVNVFEEEIARQRVEEDLRLYGSRPESADAVDIDKPDQLAILLPSRSFPEFAAAVDRPAKVRIKGESQNWDHQMVPAVGWDPGASPPVVWLYQSAVPWVAPVIRLSSPIYEVRSSYHFQHSEN